MKPLEIKITTTINLDAAEVEIILDELAARVVAALPASKPEEEDSIRPTRATGEMLSVRQLANRWQMHVESVRRMIREKRLPAVRIGRRLRIAMADVEGFEGDRLTNHRRTMQ